MIAEKQLFKRAILEALSQKYEQELAGCQEDAKCSKEHYLRISKITGIHLARVMGKRRSIGRTFVAILIAAALLLAGCTAYVYRNEIKDFIEEFYDNYIKVSYSEGKINENFEITEFYSLSYVPAGYELISETHNTLYAGYWWKSSSGEVIIFEQIPNDKSKNTLDLENGYTKNINFGNINIYCRVEQNCCFYLWNNGKYLFSMTSSKDISEEELFRIFNGIVVID